jgi:hypothetical protein
LFLFFLVAAATRPALVAPLAAAVLGALLLLDSPHAVAYNWRALVETHTALPFVLALVGLALAGAWARPRLRALAAPDRPLVAALLFGALSLPIVIAVLLSSGRFGGSRYLVMSLPVLAIACATIPMAAARALSRSPLATAVAAAALALGFAALARAWRHEIAQHSARPSELRMADAERIAERLHADGLSYGDLYQHLRAPSDALTPALAALDPAPRRVTAESALVDDLLLVKVPRALIADAHRSDIEVIPLAGTQSAVLLRFRPLVDHRHLTVCYRPLDAARDGGGCIDTAPDAIEPEPEPGQARFAARGYPFLRDAARAFPPNLLNGFGGTRVSVRMSVAAPAAATVIALLPDPLGWRIGEVSGVRTLGALPARRVELAAGAERGTITFTRELAAGHESEEGYWLPTFAEYATADALAARLVDHATADPSH